MELAILIAFWILVATVSVASIIFWKATEKTFSVWWKILNGLVSELNRIDKKLKDLEREVSKWSLK
jgi:GT2 family glycosyltransferase